MQASSEKASACSWQEQELCNSHVGADDTPLVSEQGMITLLKKKLKCIQFLLLGLSREKRFTFFIYLPMKLLLCIFWELSHFYVVIWKKTQNQKTKK